MSKYRNWSYVSEFPGISGRMTEPVEMWEHDDIEGLYAYYGENIADDGYGDWVHMVKFASYVDVKRENVILSDDLFQTKSRAEEITRNYIKDNPYPEVKN